MKTTSALVTAGGASHTLLARMPTVLAGIGPVKAASFRVARRIANSLGAGHAVEHYADLDQVRLIWVSVPEAALPAIVQDLAAGVKIGDKMVVLCETRRNSAWATALRAGGARVATLNAVAPGEHMMITEGDPEVLRELQRVAAAEKRKLIRIRPAAKPVYFTGAHLASELLLPWVAAAVESLRAAGFSRADATQVAEALGLRSLRAYAKSGRKAWGRAAESNLRDSLDQDLDALRGVDPVAASLYAAGIEHALRYFETPAKPR